MSKIIAAHAFKSIPRAAIFVQNEDGFQIIYIMPDGSKDWDVTFHTQEEAQKFFDREITRDSLDK